VAVVADGGKAQKNQPQHGRRVFGGLQVGVNPQAVGGLPEIVFELFELVGGHAENVERNVK